MRDIRFLLKTHYGISRALVIGIDKYQRASPLAYAVSDATAIKQVLVEALGFPPSEVVLLTDAEATKQSILKAYMRFAADDVGLDDRIVVFFAGHGHTKSGSRGDVGYLVPHDADLVDASTFIRWDELTRNADLVRAKHIFFVMDACYGGLALVRTTGPGSTRFLKDMLLRTSRQVLTAGKADEVVADSGGPIPEHSVFTGHLLQALQGSAATPDGILTASAVMSYVYSKVASDKNSNQTPHHGHIDGDGDMILQAPGLGELEESDTKDLDRLVSLPYPETAEEFSFGHSSLARVKSLLASEAGAIELHDLLTDEVRRFLSLTSADSFAASGQFSVPEFVSRLERYEGATLDLSILLACISYWGRAAHLTILQKSVARSSDRLESGGGLIAWLALRWYPLLLELYCAGIAAVDGRRYDSLAALFGAPLPNSDDQRGAGTFVEAASKAILELNRSGVLKQIPGHERNYVPLSEYLFKILQPRLDDALFIGKNYESAFDVFEVFFALVAADARVQAGLDAWAPIGRFGWKRGRDNSPLGRVLKEAETQGANWPPLTAGLFGGDFQRFQKIAEALVQITSRLSWY